MIDKDRADIRARMKEEIRDMAKAERKGSDKDAMDQAEALMHDAAALRDHLEEHSNEEPLGESLEDLESPEEEL